VEDLWLKYRDQLLDFGGRLVGAALILILGWLAFRLVFRLLRGVLGRSRFGPVVSSYVQSLAQTAFIVVLILAVLNQLGVETTSLVALVGAAGVALALSLQGVLSNLASGLVLISYRLFRVGDVIEVGGMTGRVSEMLPFHVVLVTSDNQRIIVPNTMLTSGAVRNHSALPHRRVQWTLAIKPQDDLAAVKEALKTCVASRPGVLAEPPPQVHVHEWSDDKRLLTVAAWTSPENYDAVQQGTVEILGKCLEDLRQRSTAGT
jgi:small conductance mechanosensitive channel